MIEYLSTWNAGRTSPQWTSVLLSSKVNRDQFSRFRITRTFSTSLLLMVIGDYWFPTMWTNSPGSASLEHFQLLSSLLLRLQILPTFINTSFFVIFFNIWGVFCYPGWIWKWLSTSKHGCFGIDNRQCFQIQEFWFILYHHYYFIPSLSFCSVFSTLCFLPWGCLPYRNWGFQAVNNTPHLPGCYIISYYIIWFLLHYMLIRIFWSSQIALRDKIFQTEFYPVKKSSR